MHLGTQGYPTVSTVDSLPRVSEMKAEYDFVEDEGFGLEVLYASKLKQAPSR